LSSSDERITDPLSAGSQHGAADSALVPEWLENLAALGWRVLVVVAVAVALWYVARLLWTATASIAVAIVVSAVFAPVVLRLRDRGRSRNAAAAIVWAAAMLTVMGALLLLALALLPHLGELATRLGTAIDNVRAESAELALPDWVSQLVEQAADASGRIGGELVASIAGSVASAATILILAAFLVFFFLRDGDKAWLWCFQSLGETKRERITAAGDDALARVGGYLRGTTVLAAVIAVSNYAFMLLLGVPLALALALLSFMATYIPYFGGLVATGAILLVTWSAAGTSATVALIVLLGLRGALVSTWIRPQVYGRTVSISPALVLLVLPAGFELGGVVGLFAAVPVTAVVLTVARSAVEIIEPTPAPPLPALVPAWLDRAAQWGWRALVVIGLVAGAILVATSVPLVVLPAILGLIFAATLKPIVRWLIGRGRSQRGAAAIAVLGSTLIIGAVLALTFTSLLEQASALGQTVQQGAESANDSLGGQLGLGADAVGSGVGTLLELVVSLSDDLAAAATVVVLSVLLSFYFLRDGADAWARLMARTRSGAKAELSAAGSRAFDVLSGYMIGTFAISFVGAASQLVIMVILDLPLALPVFVLSLFGGFIPYIGSLLTTALAFLIAVAVGSPLDILVMGIWTVVFNLVQGNIVAPLVYGKTTHIHPAVVLVAIPAGAALAGILGMFLIVPALGVVAATWRTVLAVMDSPEPAEEAETSPAAEPPPVRPGEAAAEVT
jgi:predicted PurR-regulated permease PerM